MARYGTALRDFKTNGPFVNDSIFTVLHHVGIDLDQVDLLCDPVILHNFSQIWACEFKVFTLSNACHLAEMVDLVLLLVQLCEDWEDLIEYVVQKFMQDYRTKTDGFDEGSVPRIPDQMQDKQISLYNHTESTACENPSFTEAELAEIQFLKTQLVASGLNSF